MASVTQLLACAVCSAACSQSCASCKKVSYCSKEHQKTDWKLHKLNCFPARLERNQELGRYLVATRNISQGEIILKEKPIVSGPNGKNGYHPLCLSCYRVVKTDYACSRCRWPMCQPKCENDPRHANYECPIFVRNAMQPFSLREIHMYEKILILRGLLQKELDPENSWLKILDLESHKAARHKNRKGLLLSNSAVEFIHKVCGLQQFEASEIDHVLGVIGTNAFVTEDNMTGSPLFRSGSFLFYNASIPAHNCIPNTKWTIQMNSEFHLMATLDIKEGDQISQLYTDSTVGTLERRSHLKESKYFSCECARCSDPTELGTFFSGIKCANHKETGCKGYLIPKKPLDNNSLWQCTNTECNDMKTVQYVEKFVSKLKSNYKSRSTDENTLLAVQVLENVLKQYLTEFHANHYLIHEIEQDIIQRISYLLASSKISGNPLTKKQNHELSERIVELSRKSLELADRICPGLTIHRGRQMFFLQQGIMGLVSVRIPKGPRKRVLTPDLRQQIEEIKELRLTGARILSSESDAREEFVLAKHLTENHTEPIRHILNALTVE